MNHHKTDISATGLRVWTNKLKKTFICFPVILCFVIQNRNENQITAHLFCFLIWFWEENDQKIHLTSVSACETECDSVCLKMISHDVQAVNSFPSFGLLSEMWKIWLNYESMSLQLNCSGICKKQISHHHIWSLISYLEKLWYLKTNCDSFGNWTAAVSETMKVTTEVWHLVMKVKNVPYLLCLVITNPFSI